MRVKKTIKISAITGILIGTSFGLIGGVVTPTASAAPVASIDLSLPLGSLGEPVSDLVNPITEVLPAPVSVDSTPKLLGANLALPLLGNDTSDNPTLGLNVTLPDAVPAITEPIGEVVQPILQPVTDAVTPITQPIVNAVRPITQPVLNPPANTPPQQPTIPVSQPPASGSLSVGSSKSATDLPVSGQKDASQNEGGQSIVTRFTSFFTSTLPDALSKFASTIIGKEVDPLPFAISSVLFLITLMTVGAIVYTTNHGGTVVVGQRRNLTKFAKAHDINQMAAFVVTTVSLGLVTIFLTLSGL